MPLFIAHKLCPNLITTEVHMEWYKEYSKQFYDILFEYDKELNAIGSDEACLEVTAFLEENRELFEEKLS